MTGYILTLAILSLFYMLALIWILLGLERIRMRFTDDKPFVSVVVAARNEQYNIRSLLTTLTRQTYSDTRYEIIIVDDESKDDTAAIANSFNDPLIRVVQTSGRSKVVSPKKNAINLGIQNARGDIILLTDADCLPPIGWIEGMVRLFAPNVGMVIGFSPAELPRLRFPFGHLLALESMSLAAIAAGTAGRGYPATCNGRNLAYRKNVYEQVGGFERINNFISGDDDLMLKLVQRTEWKIQYAYDAALSVPTQLVKNAKQFANQRLRHASKGFFYDLKKVIGLMLAYFYNLLILLSLPLALFHTLSLWAPVVFIGLKSLFEFVLLYQFAATMQRRHFLSVFPLAEILHVPYVVFFGALGPFIKFKWKEKENRHA